MVQCNCLTYGSADGAPHHVSQRTRFRHLEKDRENSLATASRGVADTADDEEDLYGEGKPTV